MKHNVLLIATLMLLFILPGCGPSEQEKILEGSWSGQMSEIDEDGDKVTYKLRFDFNRSRDLMTFRLTYGMPGVGDICEASYSGDWLADDEEVLMFPDEDSMRFDYSPEIEGYCNILGVSLSDFKSLIEVAMVQELENIQSIPIKSLTANELRIEFDNSTVTLYKQLLLSDKTFFRARKN